MPLSTSVKSVTFTLTPKSGTDVATLYLRAGTPSMLHPNCSSVMVRGAVVTCTLSNPAAGTYYGIVNANTQLNGVSIVAAYTQSAVSRRTGCGSRARSRLSRFGTVREYSENPPW